MEIFLALLFRVLRFKRLSYVLVFSSSYEPGLVACNEIEHLYALFGSVMCRHA